MRFQRRDLPGLVIAVAGPLLLFAVVLESYQLWDHHGSPLLAILSMNLAIVGGLVGAFWRFVKAKDAFVGIALALVLAVAAVVALRAGGGDDGAFGSTLKILAVVLFLALNVAIAWQLLVHGLNPILQRRDERRSAAAEAAAQD